MRMIKRNESEGSHKTLQNKRFSTKFSVDCGMFRVVQSPLLHLLSNGFSLTKSNSLDKLHDP
jgi:hypothetical protein